jgi:hypothetical protein
MASIQLTRREAEEGDLPDVCMRCGAPATVRKRRMFVSHPLWVYVLLPIGYLPYVIVAAIMTQRVRCYTLFCGRHKNHWLYRALFIWGAFVLMIALIVGSFAVVISMETQLKKSTDAFVGILCFGSLGLMFCWLISIPIMQLTAIHPGDVTERRLTLKRVSPTFVDAVRDYRERPRAGKKREEYWSEFQSRRSAASEDVYDPERERESRSNREGFEEGA